MDSNKDVTFTTVDVLMDLTKYCRLCANYCEIKLENVKDEVSKLIQKYFNILLSDDIRLPQGVCSSCVNILEEFDKYAASCMIAQNKLKEFVESYELKLFNIKDESNEIQFDNESFQSDSNDSCSFNINESKNDIPIESDCKKGQKTDFNTHINNDKQNRSYKCKECGIRCKNWYGLQKHTLEVHKNQLIKLPNQKKRSYICDKCDQVFHNILKFKAHYKIHKEPKQKNAYYKCPLCIKKFKAKSAMKGHKRAIHDNLKDYVCDVCGYSTSRKYQLQKHLTIHSDERPFVCNDCGQRFKMKSALVTHSVIHSEATFQCPVCSKVLKSKRTLRKHTLVHTDIRKYVCTYCDKAFKNSTALKVHQVVHTGDVFNCPHCPQTFKYSATRNKHKKLKHPEIVEREMREREKNGFIK